MITDRIIQLVENHAGATIPRPRSGRPYRIKGIGKWRGKTALIYTIPSFRQCKPHEMGITLYEFELAFKQLQEAGSLTRSWFIEHLRLCAREDMRNFDVLGGVLEMLGLASHCGRGSYIAARHEEACG